MMTNATNETTNARPGILERAKDANGRTYYRGKVYLLDDSLARVRIKDPKKRYSEDAARDFIAFCQEEEDRTQAIYSGRRKGEAKARAAHVAGPGELVSSWFGRYYDWRAAKAIGGESVADSRGRFRKWMEDKLGHLRMVDVTRDHLEAFVAFLDGEVAAESISWKTASNIWGEVTAGFNVAKKGKDKSLRVLDVNPCESVAGPDKGTEKRKPFLRPDEVVSLLSCEGVPLERRHVYAVAIYTAMRQGELRALRVADVDLDAMQIHVSKTRKGKVEKARTKTGRARVVNVEPNLVPLLEVLTEGKGPGELVLDVHAHNRCASNLRADLLVAGCSRPALHVETETTAHLTFHHLRDTCLTHMAVRRDPPQDVQWRAGHTTSAMTERYIGSARYEAGANFGEPLPPLPRSLLGGQLAQTTLETTQDLSARNDSGRACNQFEPRRRCLSSSQSSRTSRSSTSAWATTFGG